MEDGTGSILKRTAARSSGVVHGKRSGGLN